LVGQFDIVFVTPSSLGSNPRIVKSAEACAAYGWSVAVISTRRMALVEPLDDAVLLDAHWTSHRIDLRWKPLWKTYRFAEEASWALGGRRRSGPMTGTAATFPLASRCSLLKARLYIAHYLAALPAAAQAARDHQSSFAFDAEDFHFGEYPDQPAWTRHRARVRSIEMRHLGKAAFVTAASPGIATAYEREYGISPPTVVLNVFPLKNGVDVASPKGSTSPGPSLYWFSQTIGPDRGLECAIEAIALSRMSPHLYLRGTPASGFEKELRALARRHRVEDRIHLLAPDIPSRMEMLASEHDLGLVSETGGTLNRQIALTNKQFSYLLGGIPLIMSDTPAHRMFAEEAEGAARLYRIGDPASLASVLDQLLGDPARLAAARATALHHARTRYNWDVHKSVLLGQIESVVGSPVGVQR
jgi:glycosyltransferase involved in cell wall biosynthesis